MSHAVELASHHSAGDEGVVLDVDAAGQQSRVGQDYVVFENTVVGDVRTRHEVIEVADSGLPLLFAGAVYSHPLTEYVGVSNDDVRPIRHAAQMLRPASENDALAHQVAVSQPHALLDHRMSGNTAKLANAHIVFDDCVGSNLC